MRGEYLFVVFVFVIKEKEKKIEYFSREKGKLFFQ